MSTKRAKTSNFFFENIHLAAADAFHDYFFNIIILLHLLIIFRYVKSQNILDGTGMKIDFFF